MNSDTLLHQATYYIKTPNKSALLKLFQSHRQIYISKHEFIAFVESFHSYTQNFLQTCININGMGGTQIPKLNISSISSIYIAAITGWRIAKTGSQSRTSLVGSTDFFQAIGFLNIKDKIHTIEKYNFCYFDHLELLPWKAYKDILCINESIKKHWESILCFEYKAKIYGIGISSPIYAERLLITEKHLAPRKLFTFYTQTSVGIIDEITQGDVYLDNKILCTIPGKLYFPKNRKEVMLENKKLLDASSENTAAITTLRYSVAVLLFALEFVDTIEKGTKIFDKAYENKIVKKLLQAIGLT